MQKEANHVEGFATECAVVTHHRLEKDKEGKLVPKGELEEPLIVRPTSEMIIGEMFSKWIESHRDLPLLINQWANVVRWEMRPRIFLRTSEFLWQEGHTAHRTKEEAIEETHKMMDIYVEFAKTYLAMPAIKGRKSESEKFPGADATYTFEMMMQDGKALQAGTSHFLGQNFAKAADITFSDEDGERKHVWTTSWGATTRLIGGMIMMHADDDGLILPPRIASSHIVIIPILHKEELKESTLSYCKALQAQLQSVEYFGRTLDVELDDREIRGGEKTWGWVKKGVPIRIEVGPKEVENNLLCVKKRTKGHRDSDMQTVSEFVETVTDQLDQMHHTIFDKAHSFRENHTIHVTSKKQFHDFFESGKKGFVTTYFAADEKMEERIKKELNVTVRCIVAADSEGICPFTDKPAKELAYFAKSY